MVRDKAIILGNTPLYKYDDAMHLIDLCEKHNIAVLGIDSFVVIENGVQPFLEHNIDFSSDESILANSYKLARDFLTLKKDYDFLFEIVHENDLI